MSRTNILTFFQFLIKGQHQPPNSARSYLTDKWETSVSSMELPSRLWKRLLRIWSKPDLSVFEAIRDLSSSMSMYETLSDTVTYWGLELFPCTSKALELVYTTCRLTAKGTNNADLCIQSFCLWEMSHICVYQYVSAFFLGVRYVVS